VLRWGWVRGGIRMRQSLIFGWVVGRDHDMEILYILNKKQL
jgi:hypothetical protein